jgi:23S rRNA pseudouridine1911/1915/1917 synthase
MAGPFSVTVAPHQAHRRLDAFVAEALPDCSRALAAQLIRQGLIRVDGRTCAKPSLRLLPGSAVEGEIPLPVAAAAAPEAIPLAVLHEDAHLIVVDKPPGLVVHPAPGHAGGTLVNALLHRCPDLGGIGGALRPGIVHRLDKDTSGVMVAAKSAAAMQALARQFKAREVRKTYLGLVWGQPPEAQGCIDLPIGRHPVARKQMSTRAPRTRAAETHWKVQENFPGVCLVAFDLKTGRTHQIRVHTAALGHPILGDAVYGRPPRPGSLPRPLQDLARSIPRHMLHSWQLAFQHPVSGAWMAFEAPLPADMQTLLDSLRRLAVA